MVHKGQPFTGKVWISDPSYQGPHEADYRVQKRWRWICDVCSTEYDFQENAKTCELDHVRGRNGWVQCPICGKCYAPELYKTHVAPELENCILFNRRVYPDETKEQFFAKNPYIGTHFDNPRKCEEWLEG